MRHFVVGLVLALAHTLALDGLKPLEDMGRVVIGFAAIPFLSQLQPGINCPSRPESRPCQC